MKDAFFGYRKKSTFHITKILNFSFKKSEVHTLDTHILKIYGKFEMNIDSVVSKKFYIPSSKT